MDAKRARGDAGRPGGAIGDRVTLTLDPLEGVVTKTGSGWYTVKFEFGGVDNFRADELTRL